MKKLSIFFLYCYLIAITLIELTTGWFNKLFAVHEPLLTRKSFSNAS